MARKQSAARKAVRMNPDRSPEYFPAGDPRAGYYQSGVSYVVGVDLSPEKGAALVDGGGYTYTESNEAPAASETPEPTPDQPADEEE